MPCCLDDQDDHHELDVDHNCCMDDQDKYPEQHDVDHNHEFMIGVQGSRECPVV